MSIKFTKTETKDRNGNLQGLHVSFMMHRWYKCNYKNNHLDGSFTTYLPNHTGGNNYETGFYMINGTHEGEGIYMYYEMDQLLAKKIQKAIDESLF